MKSNRVAGRCPSEKGLFNHCSSSENSREGLIGEIQGILKNDEFNVFPRHLLLPAAGSVNS